MESSTPLVLAIIFMFVIAVCGIGAVLLVVVFMPKGIQRLLLPGVQDTNKLNAELMAQLGIKPEDEEETEGIHHPSPFAYGFDFEQGPSQEDLAADAAFKNEIFATIEEEEQERLSQYRPKGEPGA